MAKKGIPQLENGFARVANEILEAIARTSLSDYESRFIHFLWRKTYGWQNRGGESKKFDSISHNQWATGTAITRRHVSPVLDRLVKRNIILKVVHFAGGRKIILWGFQKRYHEWLTPLFEPPEELPHVEEAVERELPHVEGALEHELPHVEGAATLGLPHLGGKLPHVDGAKLPHVDGATKDNKDNTKDLIPPTAFETGILSIFKKLKGWSFSEEEDLEWLRDFLRDDPETTIRDIKKCQDFYSGRLPPKNKGPWKVRLRNWMDTQKKMATKRGGGYRGRAGQVPTTEELKEQARKKGVV